MCKLKKTIKMARKTALNSSSQIIVQDKEGNYSFLKKNKPCPAQLKVIGEVLLYYDDGPKTIYLPI